MSKSLCPITLSALVAAAAAQLAGLLIGMPLLGWLGVALTLLATFLYFVSSKKSAPASTSTSTNYAHPRPAATTYDNAEDRETGTVKWFNTTKGFGFISRDLGEDIFVHFRAIRGEGHRVLVEGQRVEFNVMAREKGLQAEDVEILSD